MKRTIRRRASGFTLIEILVVVALIGLLAAFVVPNVMGQSDKAKVDLSVAQMKTVASQLELYRLHNGRYPTTQEGLRALVEKPESARNWTAPYLASIPRDAWGNEYYYASPGATGGFDLISLGADGAEGGSGFDADLNFRDSR